MLEQQIGLMSRKKGEMGMIEFRTNKKFQSKKHRDAFFFCSSTLRQLLLAERGFRTVESLEN